MPFMMFILLFQTFRRDRQIVKCERAYGDSGDIGGSATHY